MRQVATGPTIFSFTEDWYEGSKVIASAHTLGTVRYEPGNGTNIYTHTQQMPGVVVKSEDSRKGIPPWTRYLTARSRLFKVAKKIACAIDFQSAGLWLGDGAAEAGIKRAIAAQDCWTLLYSIQTISQDFKLGLFGVASSSC